MKLHSKQLVVGLTLILLFVLYLNYTRDHTLPTGQLSESQPVNVDIPTTSPEAITGKPSFEISTTKGTFTIQLRPDLAPESVYNFLTKWSRGVCNSTVFHRVEDWVVQGCDPSGDGTGGLTTLPTEISSESFTRGSVGVARKPYPKDKSNDSQFFIVKKDSRFLDGDYTYLGKVITGLDVVDSLAIGDRIQSIIPLTK
jgi:peptidylprolyl isomerase